MIVSQKMVADAEVMCQPNLPILDVKYHLRVATNQEHALPIDVVTSPSSFESVRSFIFLKVFMFPFIFFCNNEVICMEFYKLLLNSGFDVTFFRVLFLLGVPKVLWLIPRFILLGIFMRLSLWIQHKILFSVLDVMIFLGFVHMQFDEFIRMEYKKLFMMLWFCLFFGSLNSYGWTLALCCFKV